MKYYLESIWIATLVFGLLFSFVYIAFYIFTETYSAGTAVAIVLFLQSIHYLRKICLTDLKSS